MLSKIVKTYFVATSLAPVCFSLAYVSYQRGDFWPWGISCLAIALILGASSLKIIALAKSRLESLPVTVRKVKSSDKEVIGFFVAYVLPLLFAKIINVDIGAVALFVVLLGFVIWGTHSFQVNPLLGVFGFHFYEIETEDGISFVLVTKRKIVNAKNVGRVVQLTEYMVLEVA